MIKADLHMHTKISDDSQAEISDIVENALSKGLQTICITDHYDMNFPPENDGRILFDINIEEYLGSLAIAKEKYKDKIELLLGIELGVMAHTGPKLCKLVKNHVFDFIIGSAHVVNGDNVYDMDWHAGKNEKEDYLEYFESLDGTIAASPCFNVLGHMDFVVRYGQNKDKFYDPYDYRVQIENALRILINNGQGLELNTSGLAKGLSQFHPHKKILKMYKEMGGEIITVGSDAHTADMLAYKFDLAEEVLKESGFKYYTIFRNQKPEFIKF